MPILEEKFVAKNGNFEIQLWVESNKVDTAHAYFEF